MKNILSKGHDSNMKKLSINHNNFTSEVNNLDLHDGELKDIYCSYDHHEIEIPVTLDTPHKKNIKAKLKFTGVLTFSISFLEPWGSGIYINEIKVVKCGGMSTEALNCEILLNSGDKISIHSSEIYYSEEM